MYVLTYCCLKNVNESYSNKFETEKEALKEAYKILVVKDCKVIKKAMSIKLDDLRHYLFSTSFKIFRKDFYTYNYLTIRNSADYYDDPPLNTSDKDLKKILAERKEKSENPRSRIPDLTLDYFIELQDPGLSSEILSPTYVLSSVSVLKTPTRMDLQSLTSSIDTSPKIKNVETLKEFEDKYHVDIRIRGHKTLNGRKNLYPLCETNGEEIFVISSRENVKKNFILSIIKF